MLKFTQILILVIFIGLRLCTSNQNSSFLKLITDERMYKEWLKTMPIDEDLILSRYNTLIDMIDLNKDHILDKEELIKWIRFISERSAQKEVDSEFRLIDKDKDGLLSFEEFINNFVSSDSKSTEDIELKKFYTELFKEVDFDKDGYLNKTEYFKLTNYYSLSKELYKKINSFFIQNDKNGDGIINKEEMEELKKENEEIVSSFKDSSEKLSIFGVDVSNEKELTTKRIIYLMRINEIEEAINDAYLQIIDLFRTRKDALPSDSNTTSISTDFAKSNYMIYIQSIIADYGDVFKYPHSIFVDVDNKDYQLTYDECTRLFGESENINDRSDLEDDYDHEGENEHISDEMNSDYGNDDVEITDEMIQKLVSLMGNHGLGDLGDRSGSMFDVFANKAEGGDLGGMDEILKMLQSLVGSSDKNDNVSSDLGDDFALNDMEQSEFRDEL